MTFALEPYGSKSDVVWSDYREQANIDLAFIGNSRSAHMFDAERISNGLSEDSFNLSTPGQLIDESYLALKKVFDEHRPDTVVYGFDFCDVQGDEFPSPGRAFIRSKDEGDFAAWLSDAAYCLSDSRCFAAKESINWVFPWLENHVKPNAKAISGNIEMKLSKSPLPDAAAANEEGWEYHGCGYGNIQSRLDYNEGPSKTYSDVYSSQEFDDRKMQTLAAMCDYCKEAGVDFVVVVPPMPVFNIFDMGDTYFDLSSQARQVVVDHGGEYYDFNLASKDFFNVENTSYYIDYQHLNEAGAVAASDAFVGLMKARAAGADVSSLFCTQEEYMSIHDYVDLLRVDTFVEEDGVHIESKPLASSEASLEYQMLEKETDGSWKEIRGWSSDPDSVYAVNGHGTCDIRVNVREQGSDSEYDRYRVVTLTY